jgi:hypothetical protein
VRDEELEDERLPPVFVFALRRLRAPFLPISE